MLSRDDAKNIIDKVVSYSKLPQCRVDLNWTEDVFIRFANNGITTSGYRITQQASISSVTDDKREGNAVVSELTDAALSAASSNPSNWPASPSRIRKTCRRWGRRNTWS